MKAPFANRSHDSISAVADIAKSADIESSAQRLATRAARRQRLLSSVLRNFVIAGAATLGMTAGSGILFGGEVVMAADCDCWEASCDSCGSRDAAMKKCLIYKSLDALAGGIESVLGLDESAGCDEMGCDDACDAATMSEMMFPIENAGPVHMHHSKPIHMLPSAPSHIPPPAPRHTPAPSAVPLPPAMPTPIESAPRNPSGQHLGTPSMQPTPLPRTTAPSTPAPRTPAPRTPAPRTPAPRAIPQPTPAPQAEPKQEGSLFDALEDPFSDDEVQNYRPYRNVRPSGYLQRAGSANSYRRAGAPLRTMPSAPIRSNSGTPARKATHRTVAPTLAAPVRQTSAIDAEPVGSGVVANTASGPTMPRVKAASQKSATTRMQSGDSSNLIEIVPTEYLPSRR
tara:strand:- start:146656 stop:147849 length:1194 start_codon:yes stop_codon:yes gene_type:complete